jgi:ATP-dependent DNA helicase RecQ
MQHAKNILQSVFGYASFRHNQEAIIQSLLENKDAFVLMPTGGGKSLCYQIPSLCREGVGVVVSPLIALMQDQVNALHQLGVRAAFLNSTLNFHQKQDIEEQLLRGELDLLYVAPERLLTEPMLALLDRCKIALFAIDEAHCVSQWGHDFRKEYQQLNILPQRYPQTPRIALTATADKRTREEIIQQLNLQQAEVFVSSFDRPNIHYAIAEAGSNARTRLWNFLQNEHPNDSGIVYCLSRKNVEHTAEWLSANGRVALPYHAGLSADLREKNQQHFLRDEGVIIVATIAFGMGIDKPDVRFVAHLNLPKSIESYYQETGRAGRDGKPSHAWMNYGLQDVITLRQMLENSEAAENIKRITQHKLQTLLGLCEMATCRRQALLAYFDEELAEPCGNCDNCMNPPETWDATVEAQKALSCVYRTDQRFGVTYVIDILVGKTDDRIRRNGHDRISTWGIGQDLTQVEWRGLFRQLIALNYLRVDMEYGVLKFTEKTRDLLKGKDTLMARKQRKPEKKKTRVSRGKTSLRRVDMELREALRVLRHKLAEEQGVPAYVIFHDATLDAMARQRPASKEAFGEISGVGSYKLQQYGDAFLEIIKAHPLPEILNNSLSDTVNESLLLFSEHGDVKRVAELRELKDETIYSHLADAISVGIVQLRDVVPLSDDDINEIELTMGMLDLKPDDGLKPLFDALEQKWSYGILRCVVASL